MVNRFVLNETSYHGAGAIKEIATEVKGRGFKKLLFVPTLILLNSVLQRRSQMYLIMLILTMKSTAKSSQIQLLKMFKQV